MYDLSSADYDRETAQREKAVGKGRKVDYARRRRNAGVALIAGLLAGRDGRLVPRRSGRDPARGEHRRGRGGRHDPGRGPPGRRRAAPRRRSRRSGSATACPRSRRAARRAGRRRVGHGGGLLALGREGWFGQRLFDVLHAYLGASRSTPRYEYREEAARDAVKSLAGEFYEKPQNATFRLTDDGRVEVQEAREGRVLDQEGTLANLDRALTDLSNEVPLAEGASRSPRLQPRRSRSSSRRRSSGITRRTSAGTRTRAARPT